MRDTFVWPGIIARKHPTKSGYYQIAFGHHRIVAIKELGIPEIDITIHDMSDAMMLRNMANENLEWSPTPASINETIHSVRDFLNAELAKYETWENCQSSKSYLIKLLDRNLSQGKFKDLKDNGVGQTTILKFLGGKEQGWNQAMIQTSLAILDDAELEREAVEILPNMEQARQFRKAVKVYHIPKEKQKKIAQKIKRNEISSRHIQKAVRKEANHPKDSPEDDPQVIQLEDEFASIERTAKQLSGQIHSFQASLEELNITQLTGAKAFLGLVTLKELQDTIKTFAHYANGVIPKELQDETNSQ
jgi:ParB-like chromosome segregation protein Spo0J